jgi:hypothetical protein
LSAVTPSAGEIRDYLLRRLPEARRARLEELYFHDDTLLNRVEDAEDQLVSDYVLGRLSPADRKIFEDALLGTPYYRDRIETTTQIRQRLSRHKAFLKKRRSPASRLFPGRAGLVAALALLVVLFVAALASALRLKSDLDKVVSSPAAPAVTADLAGPVIVLAESRGSAVAPLRILRPSAGSLVFVLPETPLPDRTRTFRLELRSAGQIAWDSGPIRAGTPEEGALVLRLPAGVPAAGRYEVAAAAEGDPGPALAIATLDIVEPGR